MTASGALARDSYATAPQPQLGLSNAPSTAPYPQSRPLVDNRSRSSFVVADGPPPNFGQRPVPGTNGLARNSQGMISIGVNQYDLARSPPNPSNSKSMDYNIYYV